MYIKEFDIVLDIKNSTKWEPFEVVQGDSQSNLLNINLVDGLEPYDLTGTTVEIVFYKSDSTTVQQTQESGVVILNAPDGKIQCTLKTNTIACPGKVIAEIRISSDEILLTSARFEFYVRKSLINDKTIESTDEFPVLTQLMQDTSTLIDQVNQIEKQVPENVVSRIDAMESGKVDKTDIVQTDTISDASKVPSSVVTNKLSSQVTELNKNLGNIYEAPLSGTLSTTEQVLGSINLPAGTYIIYANVGMAGITFTTFHMRHGDGTAISANTNGDNKALAIKKLTSATTISINATGTGTITADIRYNSIRAVKLC